MSLRDALALKNKVVVLDGTEVTLRRPSVADLAEATQQAKNPDNFAAWLVFRHLLAENGKPYFDKIEEVYECDGYFVELIAVEVDRLYGEGRD
jgi:hypothetical protein